MYNSFCVRIVDNVYKYLTNEAAKKLHKIKSMRKLKQNKILDI